MMHPEFVQTALDFVADHENRNINFALYYRKAGHGKVGVIPAWVLYDAIERNGEKLVRLHDGVRLRELTFDPNSQRVKNFAIRALCEKLDRNSFDCDEDAWRAIEKIAAKATESRDVTKLANDHGNGAAKWMDIAGGKFGKVEVKGIGGLLQWSEGTETEETEE